MSWITELAGEAESIIKNLDKMNGAGLRVQSAFAKKNKRNRNEVFIEKELPFSSRVRTSLINRKTPLRPSVKGKPKDVSFPPVKNFNQKQKRIPVIKTYGLDDRCPQTLVTEPRNQILLNECKPQGYIKLLAMKENSNENLMQRINILEAESKMLKNTLKIAHNEFETLCLKFRKNEYELEETNAKLAQSEFEKLHCKSESVPLLEKVKTLETELSFKNTEINEFKLEISKLKAELSVFQSNNKELEELLMYYNDLIKGKDVVQNETDNNLQRISSTFKDLTNELQKSKNDYKRLSDEWHSYKSRMEKMIAVKDEEIKTMQEAYDCNTHHKQLVEKIDFLKKERNEALGVVKRIQVKCYNMKKYVENLESRIRVAEEAIIALRNALKEEHSIRMGAEATAEKLAKQLKDVRNELSRTAVSLRAAIREREDKIAEVAKRNATCSNNSSINVAEYDKEDQINKLKQRLVQRQDHIDSIMAENSMLKVRLQELETRSTKIQSKPVHHEAFRRFSLPGKLTRYIAPKGSNALFSVFVMLYMACLHVLLITVLLSNTPDPMPKFLKL